MRISDWSSDVCSSDLDRQSGDKEQENAQATAVQKSENSSGGESTFSLAIDTSHAGETAPDFPFEGPDGEDVTLADFRGKPLLVNLWATWCGPCVIEMPVLDKLAVEPGGKMQDLPISQERQGKAEASPFFKKPKID